MCNAIVPAVLNRTYIGRFTGRVRSTTNLRGVARSGSLLVVVVLMSGCWGRIGDADSDAIHGRVMEDGGREIVLVRNAVTGALEAARSGRRPEKSETSFHLGYDRFSRLRFLSEFIVDSSGTRVDRRTHYFATDGRTVAFEDQVGVRGSDCAFELRQRRRIFFDSDFQEVRRSDVLLNEDREPVPAKACSRLADHRGKPLPDSDSLLEIHGIHHRAVGSEPERNLTTAEIAALVKRIADEYSAIRSAIPSMTRRQHTLSGATGSRSGEAESYSQNGSPRMIRLFSSGTGGRQVWELYYLEADPIFAFARGVPASGRAAGELRFHFDQGTVIRAREADRLLSTRDPAVRERALSVWRDARGLYESAKRGDPALSSTLLPAAR